LSILQEDLSWDYAQTIEASGLLDSLSGAAGRELPGPEGTTVEMDELRTGIKPYATIPQPQRSLANLAKLDTGNIEVECLPLNV